MILLSLYTSILTPILSEWIYDEDLCYLDTAVCSRNRKDFLRLLELCSIINTDIYQFSFHFKNWVTLRRFSLKKYSIGKTLTSKEEARLFKRKHLLQLQLKSNDYKKLSAFLDRTMATVDNVRLNYDFRAPEAIAGIGHRITDFRLYLTRCESEFVRNVAKSCPHLTSISLSYAEDTGFLIEYCPQLQTIYKCDLRSFVGVLNWYSCDLKRSSVVDESAVCLGEGKYFNLTGMDVISNDIVEPDCEILTPLMKHLTKLYCQNTSLLKVAASRCSKLTALHFSCFTDVEIKCTIIRYSPLLRSLKLFGPGIACIDAVILHCPLFEKLDLVSCPLDSRVLTQLLHNTSLTSLYSTDVGMLILHIKPRMMKTTLCVSGFWPRDLVELIVKHCNGSREVDTTAYKLMDEDLSRLISIRSK